MKQLNPYLNLRGRCRQAFEFYRNCFPAAEAFFQTFRDAPADDFIGEVAEEAKDNILHAELKCGDMVIMGSDGWPGAPSARGGSISLSVVLADTAEQTRLFNALAAGGEVTAPLRDASWGTRFGIVTDKFGIQWMLHVHRNQADA